MDIEKIVKENALKLLVNQLKIVKKYVNDKKNTILNGDEKYEVKECLIEIGKVEAFNEVENVIDRIITKYNEIY